MANKRINIFSDTNADIVDDGSDPVLTFKNEGSGPAIRLATPNGTLNLYGDSLAGGSIGSATLSSNAATLNKRAGFITSEDLTTTTGTAITITITNSYVTATSIILVSAGNGTNTGGQVSVLEVTPGSGSFTVRIKNASGATAFNGTITLSFYVVS